MPIPTEFSIRYNTFPIPPKITITSSRQNWDFTMFTDYLKYLQNNKFVPLFRRALSAYVVLYFTRIN